MHIYILYIHISTSYSPNGSETLSYDRILVITNLYNINQATQLPRSPGPRYSLVVDKDVKKTNKQTNKPRTHPVK